MRYPPEVITSLLEGLAFVYADTIDDVLDAALMRPDEEGSGAVESEEAAEAVR